MRCACVRRHVCTARSACVSLREPAHCVYVSVISVAVSVSRVAAGVLVCLLHALRCAMGVLHSHPCTTWGCAQVCVCILGVRVRVLVAHAGCVSVWQHACVYLVQRVLTCARGCMWHSRCVCTLV